MNTGFPVGISSNWKGLTMERYIFSEMEQKKLPLQLEVEEFSGIAVAGEMPDGFLRLLEKPGRPMVLMDFESRAVSACSLLTENYYWGSAVTQYLIDRGHRKIGFVGQIGATKSITDRYFGYRRTLLLNHLSDEALQGVGINIQVACIDE